MSVKPSLGKADTGREGLSLGGGGALKATRTALAILAGALAIGWGVAGSAAPKPTARVPAAAVPAAEPPPSAPAPPRSRPGRELLDRSWRGGSDSLAERAKRTRGTALQLGIWSLDPAARAILADETIGSEIERAEAAALLAPELPDASFALAKARLLGGSPGGALDALFAALAALDRHPEASPWVRVTFFDAAARTAIAAGLAFVAVAALGALIAMSLPLALRFDAPPASAGALLGALLLLPAVLGEGVAGVACAGAALAIARGGIGDKIAAVAALLLVFAGIGPLAAHRDDALVFVSADPVGRAASGSERDFASSLDRIRLERAAAVDPLARQALALDARREGDLAEAGRRFRTLLQQGEPPADLLNNAANTIFAAGHYEEALALYERAVEVHPTSLALFNLAQSYGRAIQLDAQDSVLAQAQALDPRAIHALTQHVAEIGTGGPVDVTVAADELRERVTPRAGGRSAFSAQIAPGFLGAGPVGAGAGLAVAIVAGLLLGFLSPTRAGGEDVFAGIARLLQRNKVMDPSARMARLAALRLREARLARLRGVAVWVVPGAAGLSAGHGLLGLAATGLAAIAWVAWRARAGLLPDPLAAAQTASFAFAFVAALAAAGYAAALFASVLLARRGGGR
jgi:tetratricopeptide (TPR) repeat protein